MIPPYGYNSRKIPTGQPYSRAILISMSCALGLNAVCIVLLMVLYSAAPSLHFCLDTRQLA